MGTQTQYFKAALTSQMNIVVLAGCALFSLVAWTTMPLLVGLAGEALWLTVAPQLPSYRRIADRRMEKFRRIDEEGGIAKLLKTVPASAQERFQRMRATVGEIRDAAEKASGPDRIFFEQPAERAGAMLKNYATLLSAAASIDAALGGVSTKGLEQRLRDLESAPAGDDSKLRELQARRREILGQRIEKVHEAERNAALLNAQLDSFDDLAGLLRDQTLVMHDPSDVTRQIDSLLTEIESSSRAYDELRNGLASFDRELEGEKTIGRGSMDKQT